jgi:hypothetical protein
MTTAQFAQRLQDQSSTVYLYVGAESDDGWSAAQVACGTLVLVEAFRADNPTQVDQWLNDSSAQGYDSAVQAAGVAFDSFGAPTVYLHHPAVDDDALVRVAIITAQRRTAPGGPL